MTSYSIEDIKNSSGKILALSDLPGYYNVPTYKNCANFYIDGKFFTNSSDMQRHTYGLKLNGIKVCDFNKSGIGVGNGGIDIDFTSYKELSLTTIQDGYDWYTKLNYIFEFELSTGGMIQSGFKGAIICAKFNNEYLGLNNVQKYIIFDSNYQYCGVVNSIGNIFTSDDFNDLINESGEFEVSYENTGELFKSINFEYVEGISFMETVGTSSIGFTRKNLIKNSVEISGPVAYYDNRTYTIKLNCSQELTVVDQDFKVNLWFGTRESENESYNLDSSWASGSGNLSYNTDSTSAKTLTITPKVSQSFNIKLSSGSKTFNIDLGSIASKNGYNVDLITNSNCTIFKSVTNTYIVTVTNTAINQCGLVIVETPKTLISTKKNINL